MTVENCLSGTVRGVVALGSSLPIHPLSSSVQSNSGKQIFQTMKTIFGLAILGLGIYLLTNPNLLRSIKFDRLLTKMGISADAMDKALLISSGAIAALGMGVTAVSLVEHKAILKEAVAARKHAKEKQAVDQQLLEVQTELDNLKDNQVIAKTLSDDIEALKIQIDCNNSVVQRLTEEILTKEQELKAAEEACNDLRGKQIALKTDNLRLLTANDRLTETIESYNTYIPLAEAQGQVALNAAEEAEKRNRLAEQRAAELDEEARELGIDVIALKEQQKSQIEAGSELGGRYERFQALAEASELKAAHLEQQVVVLEKRLDQLKKAVKKEDKDAVSDLEAGLSEINSLQKQIDELNAENKAAREEAGALQEQIRILEAALSEKRQNIQKGYPEESNIIEMEISEVRLLRQEIRELEQQKSLLEEKLNHLTRDIAAHRGPNAPASQPGLFSTLASLFPFSGSKKS